MKATWPVLMSAIILTSCGDAGDPAQDLDVTTITDDSASEGDGASHVDSVGPLGDIGGDTTTTPPPDVPPPLNDVGPNTDTPGDDDAGPAPSDEAYFALDHVLNVEVTLDPADWEALRMETRTIADILGGDCLEGPPDQPFSWFPATVTVDGVTVEGAGVRKKGYLGSMSYDKPSLKVRFDKYGDELLGGALQRLTLNNARQDGSKLNTCMSYHVFALAGAPTPRCNFATVRVNGEDMGLFVHVESIKKDFVRRHFDDDDGNLYEGTLSDFRPIWKNSFDKKTNLSEADWSDIDALTAALEDPTAAGLEALASLVDIDRFLTHWAIEVLVGHWDGYAGNRNNFYLYREPGKPFVFIPWGPDSSFSRIDHPFQDIDDPQSVMAHSAIANRLYKDDTMRAAYVERITTLLDTVWDEEALKSTINAMAAIVGDHASGQERSQAGWDAQRLRKFVDDRRGQVLADLEPTPAAWPWPLGAADICWQILGAVDLSFQTTWGTLDVEDFMGTGDAQIQSYIIDSQPLSFLDAGVTSGMEEGSGVISIIQVDGAGVFDVLSVYVPADQVAPGTVQFTGWNAPGLRLRFAPPNYELEYMGRLDSLTLVLEQASMSNGATVSGHLQGTIYNFGGYVSGSGSSGAEDTSSGLIINEVATKGDPLDWFELYNSSGSPQSLDAFLVADDLSDVTKRVPFPEGLTIDPGAYLQITCDKEAWPGFALGDDEELGIWTSDGVPVTSVNWGAGQAGDGATYARIPDVTGPFIAGQAPTPGAPND